jgi:hypothetical protein
MRKVVLCLTALVLNASSSLAGQREAILSYPTYHYPTYYGPSVPTGIYVGGPTFLTTISEQGFFVTYGHDDPCKIRGGTSGLIYVCPFGAGERGPR